MIEMELTESMTGILKDICKKNLRLIDQDIQVLSRMSQTRDLSYNVVTFRQEERKTGRKHTQKDPLNQEKLPRAELSPEKI